MSTKLPLWGAVFAVVAAAVPAAAQDASPNAKVPLCDEGCIRIIYAETGELLGYGCRFVEPGTGGMNCWFTTNGCGFADTGG